MAAANRYAKGLVQSSRLSFLASDGCQAELDGFTHVIVASLVEQKADILAHLEEHAPKSIHVGVRFGKGLHRLINFPLPNVSYSGWDSKKMDLDLQALYHSLYLSRS